MATIDRTGGVAPWRVKVGDPIVETFTGAIAGVALDFTGATATGTIRAAESLDASLVATFTMSFPTTASVKASHPAGIAAPGKHWWAWRIVTADGTIHRGQGPLVVEPAGV